MAINQFAPRFRKGTVPTPAIASGTVLGGTFVKVAGDKDADGNIVMAHCGLGDRAAGVAEYDADVSLGSRFAVTPPPSIARVQPGANITAGDQSQSDANGKAIPLGAAVAAKLDTGVVGNNNAITWTAKAAGVGGNSVTVTIVDPGGTTAALSVDVAENDLDITVSLARASSAITTTAQQLMDAIEANGQASDLVTVANKSTSTGAGVVAAVTKTNLAGDTDPEGGGHVVGIAQQDALSTDRFVEIALID
jgi:hypothetical protein